MGQNLLKQLTRLLLDKTVEISWYFVQSYKRSVLPPHPSKNTIKIDSVKMQRKQYTHSSSKAKKQNILLFILSTYACTTANNNITSTCQWFKQIPTTTFTILEKKQYN